MIDVRMYVLYTIMPPRKVDKEVKIDKDIALRQSLRRTHINLRDFFTLLVPRIESCAVL